MLAVCVSSLSQNTAPSTRCAGRRILPDLGIDVGEIDLLVEPAGDLVIAAVGNEVGKAATSISILPLRSLWTISHNRGKREQCCGKRCGLIYNHRRLSQKSAAITRISRRRLVRRTTANSTDSDISKPGIGMGERCESPVQS